MFKFRIAIVHDDEVIIKREEYELLQRDSERLKRVLTCIAQAVIKKRNSL